MWAITYHCRPRNSVRAEVVVDVGRVTGICRLDESRDLGRGARRRASTTDNVDLCAADIELRRTAGVVDAERLDAQQVLAAGDALGDVVGVRD